MIIKLNSLAVISCQATETENATFGTGKQRNCTKNGKPTTEFAFQPCGILTNRRNSQLPDGTEKLNIGTKDNFPFRFKLCTV